MYKKNILDKQEWLICEIIEILALNETGLSRKRLREQLNVSETAVKVALQQLDKDLNPIAVAGCPPDSFSEDGQLWGNPLYDWEYHKYTNYKWWIKRIKYCYNLSG